MDVGGAALYVEYAHVRHRSILVRVGDTVRTGQPIAQVGDTGASGEAWASDARGGVVHVT